MIQRTVPNEIIIEHAHSCKSSLLLRFFAHLATESDYGYYSAISAIKWIGVWQFGKLSSGLMNGASVGIEKSIKHIMQSLASGKIETNQWK